ncbi:hypothetical protein KI387_005039, partial [Taxus chinensis]
NSRLKWSGGISNEFIDALPCIDHDYADPKVKDEVDRMVKEVNAHETLMKPLFCKDCSNCPLLPG